MLSAALRYNAGLIRANGTPFFTGDGSTSSAQLVDRHGNPISSSQLRRVDAIHRTDWQGRQLLYPTARTNWLRYSEKLDTSPWFSGGSTGASLAATVTTAHFGDYLDAPPYWSISRQVAMTSYLGNYATPGQAVGTAIKLRFSLRAGAAASCAVGIYNSSSLPWGAPSHGDTARIISGPGNAIIQTGGALWLFNGLSTTQDILCEITRFTQSGDAAIYGAFFYPTNTSATSSADVLVALPMISVGEGAYISTPTNASRTVTDYTLSGSTVNFGEPPAGESSPGAGDAAVCDWTGVARR